MLSRSHAKKKRKKKYSINSKHYNQKKRGIMSEKNELGNVRKAAVLGGYSFQNVHAESRSKIVKTKARFAVKYH